MQELALLAADPSVPEAAPQGGGPFGFLADTFESLLKVLDSALESAHVPYSYGYAIILLTVLVKLATFPLTQKQVQSTVALQALSPRVKELQAKYANDPETLQLETARLYREAGVNPLAGCLPTVATIPVFIGLYNALTQAANEGLLDNEGFYWIPSLAGPTSLDERNAGAGTSWLFPLVDGHPPIGWETAGLYLLLPLMLVASQYASQKILSAPNQDPSQAQAQAILKLLPLMIGWFSLNVPSGLTLYWLINNLLSTGQQIYLKQTTKVNVPPPAAETSGPSAPIVKPKEERVKKVTGKDVGARRKKQDEGIIDVEVEGSVSYSKAEDGKGDSDKGDKFRALKAREAAAKAASRATPSEPEPRA